MNDFIILKTSWDVNPFIRLLSLQYVSQIFDILHFWMSLPATESNSLMLVALPFLEESRSLLLLPPHGQA
jgi:hypothetical protein